MADKNVSINISATDNASTPIRTVSRSLEQMRNDAVAAVRPVEMLQNALAAAGITVFVKQVIEASLVLEKFGAQYKAIFGTSQSANELKAVSDMANRLGLELKSTGEAYGKFAAAARGSSLEGQQARKIFEGLSVGMTALKLGPEEAGRAFAQLQQMMSKGKVQMEEVRTLSESLPGAMQMIADSMGITTSQLSQQMEKGNVLASDVLPKLAAQMRLTYGKAAEEAANQGQAAINRFHNTLLELKGLLGDKIMPLLVTAANSFRDLIRPFIDQNSGGWKNFKDILTFNTKPGNMPGTLSSEKQSMLDEQLRDDAYRGIYEARRNALRAAREKAAATKKPEIHDSNVTASDPALEALKELTKQIITTTPGIDRHSRAIDLLQEKYGELAEKSGAVEVALAQVWTNLSIRDAVKETSDEFKAMLAVWEQESPALETRIGWFPTPEEIQDISDAYQMELRDIDRTALGGMRNAIYDYTQSASNMGEQIKNTFTSAFKSMEDSMVNFITKGKFDFKSMADSIIADIVRIQVKQMLSGALNSSGLASVFGTTNNQNGNSNTGSNSGTNATAGTAAGSMLGYVGIAAGVVMALGSAMSEAVGKINALKDAIKEFNTGVADKTMRLQGNVTQADYIKAQEDQAKAMQDLVSKYDSMIKKRGNFWSSLNDWWNGTQNEQDIEINLFKKNKEEAIAALQEMQKLELEGIEKKIRASTVPLQLKELELKGLEYTAEYTYLLNIQREAELVGLDKVNQATQQRIWILEDAAKKEAKLSELTKNLEAAQERYDKAFGLDLQSQADALRDSADTLKGILDMQIDAQSSLLSAFKEIKYGDLAQLSPQAAYENAKSAFATADAKDLPAAAKALMTASKAYNATGKAFFDDQKMVLERIGTEAGISADTSLDALNTQISQLIQIKNEIAGGNKDQALQLSTLSTNIETWRVTNNNAINTLAAATRAATTREQTAASAGLTSAQGALNSFNNPAPYSPPVTQTQSLTGQVTLFKDNNFSGDSKGLGIGEYPTAGAMGFGNDWLSSIKVPAGYMVTLFNDDYYQGISAVLKAGEYPSPEAMGFPNDFLSSIKITKAPGYATGTPFVPTDMLANIHQGEIIMDRASSDVLRKYGIPARGSADNRGVEERLDRLIENGKNLDRRLSNIEQKARLVANA